MRAGWCAAWGVSGRAPMAASGEDATHGERMRTRYVIVSTCSLRDVRIPPSLRVIKAVRVDSAAQLTSLRL